MKKLLLVLLTVCLLIVPVYAEEITNQPVVNEVQENHVVVGTLDELQAAIAIANDGDTIAVSQTIIVDKDCDIGLSDKQIVLIRESNFNGHMVEITGSNVSFFSIDFDGQDVECAYSALNCINSSVTIENCDFYNNFLCALGFGYNSVTTIMDCGFINNNMALSSGYPVNLTARNCSFKNNCGGMACISLSGKIDFENCVFESNCTTGIEGGALMLWDGTHTITACSFIGNKTVNAKGAAIYNGGELIIADSLFTGNKSGVAGDDIYNWGDGTTTIFNTDQKLIELYGISGLEYNGMFEDNGADVSHDDFFMDSISGDSTGIINDANRFIDCENSTRITLPVFGYSGGIHVEAHIREIKDDSDENPPETPETPTEPPQKPAEQDRGNPFDDSDDTPETSHEPADGGYTPPTDYRPSQRPTKPVVTTTEPTDIDIPQTQPDNSIPAPAQPPLVCNGAVMDTTRTVVLFGYDDGLLHEDDPLTRAQLATIICRLLDDESIAKYSNAKLAFSDIAADAWCADYVRVIQAAGIVNGVGGSRYDPNGLATWAQIITIFSRFVGSQSYELKYIQYNGWATQAIQTAVALNWIEDSVDFTPDAIISRGELTKFINGVLALYQ